jgi:hypothetical protein
MTGCSSCTTIWQGSTGEQLAAGPATPGPRCCSSCTPRCRRSIATRRSATTRATPTALLFDYHRNYLQTLAYLFADDPIAPRATAFLADTSVPEMDQPFMYVYDFLYSGEASRRPRTPISAARTTRPASASSTRARAGPRRRPG